MSAPPTMLEIAELVASLRGLTVADLKGPRQDRVTARARQEAFYLIRQQTGHSSTRIGMFFGRNYSTVLTGARRHAERLSVNTPTKTCGDNQDNGFKRAKSSAVLIP